MPTPCARSTNLLASPAACACPSPCPHSTNHPCASHNLFRSPNPDLHHGLLGPARISFLWLERYLDTPAFQSKSRQTGAAPKNFDLCTKSRQSGSPLHLRFSTSEIAGLRQLTLNGKQRGRDLDGYPLDSPNHYRLWFAVFLSVFVLAVSMLVCFWSIASYPIVVKANSNNRVFWLERQILSWRSFLVPKQIQDVSCVILNFLETREVGNTVSYSDTVNIAFEGKVVEQGSRRVNCGFLDFFSGYVEPMGLRWLLADKPGFQVLVTKILSICRSCFGLIADCLPDLTRIWIGKESCVHAYLLNSFDSRRITNIVWSNLDGKVRSLVVDCKRANNRELCGNPRSFGKFQFTLSRISRLFGGLSGPLVGPTIL